MRPRRPIHQILASHHRSQWQAGGNALGDTDDVGNDAPVLNGEPLPRPPHPRLHLVGHEEDAVPVTELAQSPMPTIGGDDVAALALHWFDEDGSHLVGRDEALKQNVLDVVYAGDVAAGVRQVEGAAVTVAIGHVGDLAQHGGEASALDSFAGRERQRAHGPPVESAEESEDTRTAGDVPRQLQRSLDRLSPRVGKEDLLIKVARHDPDQLLGQLDLPWVVEVSAGHVKEFLGLTLNGPYDIGMGMASGTHGDARCKINVAVAIHIPDKATLSPIHDEGISTGVGRRDNGSISLHVHRRPGAGDPSLSFQDIVRDLSV